MLELLRAEGIASPEAVPMIPMRISSVKGEPVVLGPPGGSGAADADGEVGLPARVSFDVP
jgi:hypothetical protein